VEKLVGRPTARRPLAEPHPGARELLAGQRVGLLVGTLAAQPAIQLAARISGPQNGDVSKRRRSSLQSVIGRWKNWKTDETLKLNYLTFI
jgi:hypothetical protein